MDFEAINTQLLHNRRCRKTKELLKSGCDRQSFLNMVGSDQLDIVLARFFKMENHPVSIKSRSHYLHLVHNHQISSQDFLQHAKQIVQYGVRWGMLDSTILQATALFEAYLAHNNKIHSQFLAEVALVCLEIAIKNNEDSVLSFTDVLKLLQQQQPQTDGRYEVSIEMLLQLERHILMSLSWRINQPTSYDFLIHFSYTKVFTATAGFDSSSSQSTELISAALPWLYYIGLNYQSGRGRKSSAIAIAAIAYVLQEREQLEIRDTFLSWLEEQDQEQTLTQTQNCYSEVRQSAWEILQEMNSEYELPQGYVYEFPSKDQPSASQSGDEDCEYEQSEAVYSPTKDQHSQMTQAALVTPVMSKGLRAINLLTPESSTLAVTPGQYRTSCQHTPSIKQQSSFLKLQNYGHQKSILGESPLQNARSQVQCIHQPQKDYQPQISHSQMKPIAIYCKESYSKIQNASAQKSNKYQSFLQQATNQNLLPFSKQQKSQRQPLIKDKENSPVKATVKLGQAEGKLLQKRLFTESSMPGCSEFPSPDTLKRQESASKFKYNRKATQGYQNGEENDKIRLFKCPDVPENNVFKDQYAPVKQNLIQKSSPYFESHAHRM